MKRLGALLALFGSVVADPILALAQDVMGRELPQLRSTPPALLRDYDGLLVAGFAGLAAALLTWAVIRLLQPTPDARSLALARIERARRSAVSQDPGAFARELGEAMRAYAEARFAVHAPLCSTEELLSALAQDASPHESWRGPLADFVVCSELARSGATPLRPAELDALLESARAFVSSEEP